jgi:hypothetical protein
MELSPTGVSPMGLPLPEGSPVDDAPDRTQLTPVTEAVELLEKANRNLQPDLLSVPQARSLLDAYARAQKLAAFGIAALAGRLDDASELARATGSSLGRARDTVATAKRSWKTHMSLTTPCAKVKYLWTRHPR